MTTASDRKAILERYGEALKAQDPALILTMHLTMVEVLLSAQSGLFQMKEGVSKVRRRLRDKNFRGAAELAAALADLPIMDPEQMLKDLSDTAAEFTRDQHMRLAAASGEVLPRPG